MYNSIFEIDMILNNKKYPLIYSYTHILFLLLILFIYITATYNYTTYYYQEGIITNNNLLKIYVPIGDIKYIQENNVLIINNKYYNYQINHINEELYVSDNYKNYQELYLEIIDIHEQENLVLKIKIEKEKKKIIYHILDCLERR